MSDTTQVKIYKTLVVNLQVFEVKTDKLVRDMTKVIDGPERRKWIADTVMWATMNGHYVSICNHDDKELLDANG